MKTLLSVLIFAVGITATATEPDTNTVMATAIRVGEWKQDKVELSVTVTAPLAAGLEEILATLAGSGIGAADLVNVYKPSYDEPDRDPYTEWTFSPTIRLDRMNAVLKELSRIQAAASSLKGSPALRFDVVRTHWSQSFEGAGSCPYPALIADARRQADEMAATAGMRVGRVVSLSDTVVVDPISSPLIGVPNLGEMPRWFSAPAVAPGQWEGPNSMVQAFSTTPGCILTVQFQLMP